MGWYHEWTHANRILTNMSIVKRKRHNFVNTDKFFQWCFDKDFYPADKYIEQYCQELYKGLGVNIEQMMKSGVPPKVSNETAKKMTAEGKKKQLAQNYFAEIKERPRQKLPDTRLEDSYDTQKLAGYSPEEQTYLGTGKNKNKKKTREVAITK